MGLDVYLRWDGITEEEHDKQITGFSIVSGHVGYLREAYHGQPYATKMLISEKWEDEPEGGFIIPNSTLVERLPRVKETAILRANALYKEDIDESSPVVKSFVDFVELHGRMEKEGKNPRIHISY